jgi:hypothetical protein
MSGVELMKWQVRSGGWHHMECSTCTLLEEEINKANNKPEEKKRKEKELEDHWAYQEEFRNDSSKTISKGIQNEEFDVTIHIDAGTAGSEYLPFYYQDITGEPVPHSAMKVKNTFVQVHGWGFFVFQSYPHLESQDSNLTIEVCMPITIYSTLIYHVQIIYRSLLKYMELTGKSRIRNFYIPVCLLW